MYRTWRRRPGVIIALLVAMAFAPVAQADEDEPLLTLTIGRFGFDSGGAKPWVVGVEYRAKSLGDWQLRPSFGLMIADNDAAFAYAEVRKDLHPHENWIVSPSFGIGLFNEADGLFLGHPIEFRSGVEFARRFPAGERLGLAVYHVSNGGLGGTNPGTEALSLSFSMPVGE